MGKARTFLKSCDIAVLLDVSPDDVTTMARKGLIKARKVGKVWRYRPKDADRLLNERRSDLAALDTFEEGT